MWGPHLCDEQLRLDRTLSRWHGAMLSVQHGPMAPALDIPPHSYGALIESTLRVVTWNVWGRCGPWEERESAIFATLHDAQPDIVVLSESWAKGEDSQCARLAMPLDLPHHTFSGVAAQEDEDALSGVAVMSRWPIRKQLGPDLRRRPRRVRRGVRSPRADPRLRSRDGCLVVRREPGPSGRGPRVARLRAREAGPADSARRLWRLQRGSGQRRDPDAHRPDDRARSGPVVL